MREQLVKFLEDKFGNLERFPWQSLEVDGQVLDGVKVIGNAECFDGNEFYHYVLDGEKLYKAYFDTVNPETGKEYDELDGVDYTKAYKLEDVTDEIAE